MRSRVRYFFETLEVPEEIKKKIIFVKLFYDATGIEISTISSTPENAAFLKQLGALITNQDCNVLSENGNLTILIGSSYIDQTCSAKELKYGFKQIVEELKNNPHGMLVNLNYKASAITFSLFQQTYLGQYNKEFFLLRNPRSKMKKGLENGSIINITQVKAYVDNDENKNSRAAKVYESLKFSKNF